MNGLLPGAPPVVSPENRLAPKASTSDGGKTLLATFWRVP